ncbi:MAG: DUF4340 domain-containing protein [Bacteroidota bacterium]
MKKTFILLGLFALLGAGSWWLLNNKSQDSTIRSGDRDFAVKDLSTIQKIFIADRSGETTTLERQEGYWLFNGEYKARPNAMENLLDAIKRVDVNYVVARAAVENIVDDIAAHGIKVEIYNKANQLIKSYYIGGATNDELGTYMIMAGSNEPFVTHIPSWEGGLRTRFALKGNEWRDRSVFSEQVDDIVAVSVEYPKQRSKSFKLIKEGERYSIKPYYEITPEIQRPLKAGAVEAFLIGFKNLQCEAFQNEHPDRDSISQQLPFVNIKLKNKGEEQVEAQFHPIFLFDNEGDMVTDADVKGSDTAVERYYAVTNSGDFLLVQHRLFEKVFWGYPSFFEEG